MPTRSTVSNHYTQGDLVQAICDGLSKLGKSADDVRVDDLGPVDEFHIGGRAATESFLDQLAIEPTHYVLDVGCGLGGACRYAAQRYGCRVTGVDLTQEFVATGNTLCAWVGLQTQIRLDVGDATNLPHPDEVFDRAYMMHVGMNIRDKRSVARELYRVVRPGGRIGIYDIMKMEEGELIYPVPWASDAAGSALSSPSQYKSALELAGFSVIVERNRRDFALAFFEQLAAKTKDTTGPPPLGLHIVMGATAPTKISNMMGSISRNLAAPVELIAQRPV